MEQDPHYRLAIDAAHPDPEPTVSDAICCALRRAAGLLGISAAVTYTSSGYTSLRAARERPSAPIISMSADPAIARRMTLAWGVHSMLVGALDGYRRGHRARPPGRARRGLRQGRRRYRDHRRNAVRRGRQHQSAEACRHLAASMTDQGGQEEHVTMSQTDSHHARTAGDAVMARLDALARFSAEPDALTRLYLSMEHKSAALQTQFWMQEAGMQAHTDAVANVVGRYEGREPRLARR